MIGLSSQSKITANSGVKPQYSPSYSNSTYLGGYHIPAGFKN
ncbi:hypothetical protein P20480_2573 [Pseudoalteromonas sp. BSi20480]|nr:hypothetical protein P20480_2573 [Pseudoalteromonas sp. BSi20480]